MRGNLKPIGVMVPGRHSTRTGRLPLMETGIPIKNPALGISSTKMEFSFSKEALSKISLKVRVRNFEKTDLCSLKVPFFREHVMIQGKSTSLMEQCNMMGNFSKVPNMESEKSTVLMEL